MKDLEKIRQHLTAFKAELEQEIEPTKIRQIELKTNTGFKINLIKNNKPLVRRLMDEDSDYIYNEKPEVYTKDLEELKQQIIKAEKKVSLINNRLVKSNQYQKAADLKALKDKLNDLNESIKI